MIGLSSTAPEKIELLFVIPLVPSWLSNSAIFYKVNWLFLQTGSEGIQLNYAIPIEQKLIPLI